MYLLTLQTPASYTVKLTPIEAFRLTRKLNSNLKRIVAKPSPVFFWPLKPESQVSFRGKIDYQKKELFVVVHYRF